jgi:lactoylglutathione lyase
MRTLHLGLRVSDLDRSLAFYAALGYEVVGEVPETDLGQLTMLKLPDDAFVAIELVHDPTGATVGADSRLSHLVVQVESVETMVAQLALRGIITEPPTSPTGSDDFRTAWVVDPDANRIELVQWPAGHAVGMTSADFHE